MAPIIDDMAQQYQGKVTFAKVDIDQNQSLAITHQVQGVPHFQVWKRGKKVEAFSGADERQLSYLVKLHAADMENFAVSFTTFPITSYVKSEAGATPEGLLKKLAENNGSMELVSDLKLDDAELKSLTELMTFLAKKDYSCEISNIHFNSFGKLQSWPANLRVPALDILRSAILHPGVASYYASKVKSRSNESSTSSSSSSSSSASSTQSSPDIPENLVNKLLSILNSDGPSVLDLRMLWRFAGNIFASDILRPVICNETMVSEILTTMMKEQSSDKTLRIPVCDCLLNCIVALETAIKNDEVNLLLTRSLEACVRLMTTESDENALYRLLVALGTVVARNPPFQVILHSNNHLKSFLSSKITSCTVQTTITAATELKTLLDKPL